ncbi:hypothetical protein [Chryseobacterium sp. SORGH_AS_1048]|nr:hypothetical protein [Chryseobacterium sp. SORGH_AS_1048]MDQ1102252.1 hypothetical protein [Chryseobacterium sp. SORGH_AS_1048]
MTEKSVENQLPVVFDQYRIRGRNLFFRPDNIYALKINTITTAEGLMTLEGFRLVPLLNLSQLKRFYPHQTKLYQFIIPKVEFKDVLLRKNKISLSNAVFHSPDLLMYTTDAQLRKSDKPFGFEVSLKAVKLVSAKIKIAKPDGSRLVSADVLNVNISQLMLDKETTKEVIPVGYKNFTVSGRGIAYSGARDFTVGSLALNPTSGELRKISVAGPASLPNKTMTNLLVDRIAFAFNKWGFVDRKLNLDVKEIFVDQAKGTILGTDNPVVRKPGSGGIHFPVIVGKVTIRNSDVAYDKNNQPLAVKNLNASVNGLQLDRGSQNSGMAVSMKDYRVTAGTFSYRNRFYYMTAGQSEFSQNKISINQFAMKPVVSRAQFIRMIPVESDLYDISVQKITAGGSWDFFSGKKFINASTVTLSSADANIFRSKIPKDDPKEKALYSRMLRTIKIPLHVQNLDLKNSKLVYEEDTPESEGPGKLTFSNFNMNVKNLNSAKMKGKPTRVDIKIACSFMNLAPLSVSWNFDVADQKDNFAISGKTVNLPAAGINPFIRPYLHVTATGTIQEMLFNFKGNPAGLGGAFNLKHKDLKVTILNKDSRQKKGLLTAIANLFVKSDSERLPQDVTIEDVERDPTKSFFNLFWKGIEQGLKKTLIGISGGKEEPVNMTTQPVKNVDKKVKQATGKTPGSKNASEKSIK